MSEFTTEPTQILLSSWPRVKTPRTYCAANTDDLFTVVSHIKQRYPDAPVIGTGISLGGMILFNYLAKYGSDSQLIAGMTVSVAWNVFESTVTLEQGFNTYINRHLTRHLVEAVKENIKLFEKHYDIDHVMRSKTIREFDDRFTAKVFGYASCDDYYKEASIHDKLHSLKVPILCLNAADDPFSPLHAIPLKDANENDNILIAVTSHGGHIGFLEGLFPRHESYMDRMFSQFIHAVFTYGEKELRTD